MPDLAPNSNARFHLNGWDPDREAPAYPAVDLEDLAKRLLGSPHLLSALSESRDDSRSSTFAPMGGVSAEDLSEAGWGVLYAPGLDPAIPRALEPLLEWRRSQVKRAGGLREFRGDKGYMPGGGGADFGAIEARSFLERNGMSAGPADPERIPYYLLLVGSPRQIPWDFQFTLDRQYAVGRLWFERPEQFATYAKGVVEAESRAARKPPSATVVAAVEPKDSITENGLKHLAEPLADRLSRDSGLSWRVNRRFRSAASLTAIVDALKSPDRDPVWFTSTHGLALPESNLERRLAYEGALRLQTGTRKGAGSAGRLDHVLTALDIPAEADLGGLIAFLFGCSTAGNDSFEWGLDLSSQPTQTPFVAALPQRLLSHEGGPALAVVGHVGPVSECSFLPAEGVSGLNVFVAFMRQVLRGRPVGLALEDLNSRHSELAGELAQYQEQDRAKNSFARQSLGIAWLRYLDARGYCLLGDPAVRLGVPAT